MRKKILIILTLLFLSISLFGDLLLIQNDTIKTEHKMEVQNRMTISISPLGLLEEFGSIQAGFSFPLNDEFQLNQDIGIYFFNGVGNIVFYDILATEGSYSIEKGFVSRTELKKYTKHYLAIGAKKNVKRQSRYYSVQFSLKVINYEGYKILNCDNNLIRFRNYDYSKKNIYRLVIKRGRELVFSNNKYLDFFTGIGIRVKVDSGKCLYHFFESNQINQDQLTVKDIKLNFDFSLGIRFGIAF